MAELRRRMAAGILSDSAHAALTEVALREQARLAPGPVGGELVEYLGERFAAGRLTPQQQDRFLDCCVDFGLVVRPVVVLGDPVPYTGSRGGRGPQRLSIGSPGPVRLTLDGRAVEEAGGLLDAREVGRHILERRRRLRVSIPNATGGTTQVEREFVARASFEVVAEPPATGATSFFADPALVPTVAAGVRVQGLRHSRVTDTPTFRAEVDVRGLPTDVAFEAVLRAAGLEYPLEPPLPLRAGTQMTFVLSGPAPAAPPAETADLILRASERAARTSVEPLNRVWRGEVVLSGLALGEE